MSDNDLDYEEKIRHHEYDEMHLRFQDYSGEPILTASVEDGKSSSICFTRLELETMLERLGKYEEARLILKPEEK